MNTKKLCRLTFHGGVTAMYLYALFGYTQLPPMPHKRPHENYAGRWKYLTYWNLIAQFLYFLLCFILDVMKASSNLHPKLTKLRDKMYAGIVMPYGVFVVAVFWTLYLIDRELIFPRVLDAVFPAWLNHVSHTVIVPVLLLETYASRHAHPQRKEGIRLVASFGLVYTLWMLYLALAREIWPYPIFYILNWGQRCAFFGAGLVFLILMYIIGEKLNAFCWGDGIVAKAK